MSDDDKRSMQDQSDETAQLRARVAELEKKLQQAEKTRNEALNEAIGSVEDEIAQTEIIMAALGDGVSIQDTDFKILFQNRIHKEMVGDHLGRYCYEAYQKQKAVCEECPIHRAFQDGQVHRQERSLPSKQGVIHVEVTASPLRDAHGRIVAGIEIVRDITARKEAEQDKERLIGELKNAIAEIRTLSGLLPICASCKNIRDDQGYWNKLEQYIQAHSEAEFTHGLCPDCARRLYPDIYQDVEPDDSTDI